MLEKRLARTIQEAVEAKGVTWEGLRPGQIPLFDFRHMERVTKAYGVDSPTVFALQKGETTILVKVHFAEPSGEGVVDDVYHVRW